MIQGALDSEGVALAQRQHVEYHLQRGELVRAGPSVEESDTLGWIEFNNARIDKSDRDRIYAWFLNEASLESA